MIGDEVIKELDSILHEVGSSPGKASELSHDYRQGLHQLFSVPGGDNVSVSYQLRGQEAGLCS